MAQDNDSDFDWEKETQEAIAKLSKIKDNLGLLRERFDSPFVSPLNEKEDSLYNPIRDALANAESQLFYYTELVGKRSAADYDLDEDDDYLL